jgi:hypothetical protein
MKPLHKYESRDEILSVGGATSTGHPADSYAREARFQDLHQRLLSTQGPCEQHGEDEGTEVQNVTEAGGGWFY